MFNSLTQYRKSTDLNWGARTPGPMRSLPPPFAEDCLHVESGNASLSGFLVYVNGPEWWSV